MPLRVPSENPLSPASSPNPSPGRALRVGIFDSGVGGLSVMQAIRARLPDAELLYAADTGHAPYGDRSEDFVCDRSERIARFLRGQGADLVVVACNTATAAAVATLRAATPDLPIVGVEPGIKPAVAASTNGRIGVFATTRTLASEKFRRLATAHADGATLVLQPCPGLATAIEEADGAGTGLEALVERYSAPLREAGVDVAVLGCTHYAFARAMFERALPGVRMIDTADAVARQTARLATDVAKGRNGAGSIEASPASAVRAWSSASPEVLAAFARRWLGLDVDVRQMTC